MSELQDLYQEVILDHNKNPRNFNVLADADISVEGHNPLCGDHFYVYLKLDGDIIKEISFDGEGCAISKASASIMTTILKGKSKSQALQLFENFHRMITSDHTQEVDLEKLGKIAVFTGVREFPTRIKCASLAWHTSADALRGVTGETASTE